MPLIAAGFVGLGFCTHEDSWRYAMIVPGVILLICAFVYVRYTKDLPNGNYKELGIMTIRNLYLLLYCLIFEPESKSTCYEFA